MYYVIQCRFSEFLIQLCIENAFFLGPCRYIKTMCRKIAFFWVRAEILLSRDKVSLESRAGPFLGFVKKYWFFEKYSPLGSGHRTLGTSTEKMALGWPQVEIEAAAIVGDNLIFLGHCPTRFCPTTIQNERPYMVHGARLAKCYPGVFTIQVLWCNG